MLNKLSIKALWILVVLLVGVVVFIMLNDQKKPKSTLPQLILSVDSNALDRISVNPAMSAPYELVKKDGKWKLKLDNQQLVDIEESTLEAAITKVSNTKPKRVITRKEENWSAYEVDELKGIKVSFYGGTESLGDLVIGKFDFNQQQRTMSNYVRLADKHDVYLIEDPLSFDWNKEPTGWRNKKVVSLSANNISKLVVSGETNVSLVKEGDTWKSLAEPMDSVAIQQLMGQFTNVTSDLFIDDLDVSQLISPNTVIELYATGENVTISIYHVDGRDVLHSTANPSSLFLFDEKMKGQLFPKGPRSGEELIN